jgi:hypothetical protein
MHIEAVKWSSLVITEKLVSGSNSFYRFYTQYYFASSLFRTADIHCPDPMDSGYQKIMTALSYTYESAAKCPKRFLDAKFFIASNSICFYVIYFFETRNS